MTRVLQGACPHDCPDTCAMRVTVDDAGRAVKVEGDPDHPITQGFLCGKVSNYLDRVYAEDRLLDPLVRTGAKGAGEFRKAEWEEALDLIAKRLLEVRERHGGEAILPYSYLGTMGLVQADAMSARVMNALGASELVRTICATAGIVGVMSAQGVSPEVDPEQWPKARHVLIWGWNPMSTAPHLWKKLLEARKAGAKLVVVDPYRSRTARVADAHIRPLPGTDAALALGMMRAVLDAGLADEEWCAEYADGYEGLVEAVSARTVEEWATECGVPAAEIARAGEEFAGAGAALLRLGVGAQRHMGAEPAYRTIACLPALTGAWRHVGGGCSYIPTATAAAVSDYGLKREGLRTGSARHINMSQLGSALTDPALDPPVSALVVWNSNPAAIAPDQDRVMAGLRREDLFTVVIEQFMTDTALQADVVLPATTQLEHTDAVFSWGHHYVTWNEQAIAPVGQAKPNSEIFRLLAPRLGLTGADFEQSDEEMIAEAFGEASYGVDLGEIRERGWVKVDTGLGPAPHADGGFVTESGKLELRPEYLPPAELADSALAERFPLALLTPKTHLFLNSTFSNQERQHSAQPEPFVSVHPDDAAARGLADGTLARIWNDRGSFTVRAHVSDDARAGVLVAPMGWWNVDYPDGRSPQATTSQALTEIAAAPTFNDNRVELEPT